MTVDFRFILQPTVAFVNLWTFPWTYGCIQELIGRTTLICEPLYTYPYEMKWNERNESLPSYCEPGLKHTKNEPN